MFYFIKVFGISLVLTLAIFFAVESKEMDYDRYLNEDGFKTYESVQPLQQPTSMFSHQG